MILIVTEQADLTADLVIHELTRRGAEFVRLNCDRLLADVELESWEPGAARLCDEAGVWFDLRRVRAVWYRRPTLPEYDKTLAPSIGHFAQREMWAHAMGVLLSLGVYWMSDPRAVWRANHKACQLAVATASGFTIPRTLITRSPDRAWEFFSSSREKVVAKPVSFGSVEGHEPELAIFTNRLEALTRSDFESVRAAPVIFQEEVPKRRDVRVTVIGRTSFAVGIDSQAHAVTQVDWRHTPPEPLRHAPIDLPPNVCSSISRLLDAFGLEFGAIDLVERDDGMFVFLEINPNGQWGWLQLRTGIDLASALAERLIAGKSS